MKYFTYLIGTFLILALTACGGETAEEAPETEQTPAAQTFDAGDEFKEQLETAMDSYFQLSAALIETDSGTAAETAAVLDSSMQAIVSEDLDEQARAFYTNARETITERTETINTLTDIEEQRYHFEYLSEAIIDLVEAFGPLTYTVYVQRCPMVRAGSADWLSREESILNPYHGNRMLRCGDVVRTL